MRRALRDSRGQTSADYLGALLLVGAIVFALVAGGVGERIAAHTEALVCQIAGGTNCKAPPKPHEPTYPCVVAGASDKLTVSGSVGVLLGKVTIEGGLEYERVKRADGTVAITLRASNKNAVGLKVAAMLNIDANLYLGQEGGITFVMGDDASANKFADQLKTTAKAIAAGPAVASMNGWDVHIDVPPVESAYYQAGPGASVSIGADTGTAYAEGKLDLSTALGVRHNFRNDETTVYYSLKGGVEGSVGAIAAQFGASFNGEAQIGVTLDSHGKPVRLTLLGIGSGEATGALRGKFKNLQRLLGSLPKGTGVDVSSQAGAGKRYEVQADLDLTDPTLRAAAVTYFTGVSPTGAPVDSDQAGEDLWNAIVDNSTVAVRTYDTKSTRQTGGVDILGNGIKTTYETAERELTGAYYLDPARDGLVPWEACRKP